MPSICCEPHQYIIFQFLRTQLISFLFLLSFFFFISRSSLSLPLNEGVIDLVDSDFPLLFFFHPFLNSQFNQCFSFDLEAGLARESAKRLFLQPAHVSCWHCLLGDCVVKSLCHVVLCRWSEVPAAKRSVVFSPVVRDRIFIMSLIAFVF